MEVKVQLQFEKSTPGTHFYSTKDAKASVKSVYIQKSSPLFNGGNPPNSITLTIVAA